MRLHPMFPLAFTVAAVLTTPPTARGEAPAPPARASGVIETDEGTSVLLDRVWRKGDVVELPEGYMRIEEDARPGEERGVGSFTVVAASPASDPAAGEGDAVDGESEFDELLDAEPEPAAVQPLAAAPAPSPASRCRDERSAYLAELWRSWGGEVKDPASFLEGLAGDDPRLTSLVLALGNDPVRQVAWSSELRRRADALAACVRAAAR